MVYCEKCETHFIFSIDVSLSDEGRAQKKQFAINAQYIFHVAVVLNTRDRTKQRLTQADEKSAKKKHKKLTFYNHDEKKPEKRIDVSHVRFVSQIQNYRAQITFTLEFS